MSKRKDNFRLGLYSSANGKTVVLAMYLSTNIDSVPSVEHRRVIPPPGKNLRFIDRRCIPIETFRRRYPVFVDKCVVE